MRAVGGRQLMGSAAPIVPGKRESAEKPMLSMEREIVIRCRLQPGDVGAIVKLHGEYYHRHNQFDTTFEPYVAMPLSELVLRQNPKERVWVVERGGEVMGCIAIADNGGGMAQLRWFLVAEGLQGQGVGRRLLELALQFARDQGYLGIVLWTVDMQDKAIGLYQLHGFQLAAEKAHRLWGRDLVEQCYRLDLAGATPGIPT